MYSIDFKTSVYQLPHFDVEIREFVAEGPDEYGDYTVTLKIDIENKTANDWSSLEFCALVLNDAGQQIGEVNVIENMVDLAQSNHGWILDLICQTPKYKKWLLS